MASTMETDQERWQHLTLRMDEKLHRLRHAAVDLLGTASTTNTSHLWSFHNIGALPDIEQAISEINIHGDQVGEVFSENGTVSLERTYEVLYYRNHLKQLALIYGDIKQQENCTRQWQYWMIVSVLKSTSYEMVKVLGVDEAAHRWKKAKLDHRIACPALRSELGKKESSEFLELTVGTEEGEIRW